MHGFGELVNFLASNLPLALPYSIASCKLQATALYCHLLAPPHKCEICVTIAQCVSCMVVLKGFVSYGGFTHVGFPVRKSVSPPTLYPSSLQLPLSPLSPSPVTTFPSSSLSCSSPSDPASQAAQSPSTPTQPPPSTPSHATAVTTPACVTSCVLLVCSRYTAASACNWCTKRAVPTSTPTGCHGTRRSPTTSGRHPPPHRSAFPLPGVHARLPQRRLHRSGYRTRPPAQARIPPRQRYSTASLVSVLCICGPFPPPPAFL